MMSERSIELRAKAGHLTAKNIDALESSKYGIATCICWTLVA
jgi:hypothetical protein